MKVDIWLDFICPFCYMGDKEFKEALDQFKSVKNIEINYRSFELDASKQRDKTMRAAEGLAKKYNMPIEKAEHIMEKTKKQVKEVGLPYCYKETISANTFDAHRLNYYAKEFNKDEDMTKRIMKAHFGEGLDIGDQLVLADLASEVGLIKEEAMSILKSDKYEDKLAHDKREAKKLGIDTVPTFIFEDGSRISGVLSPEDYIKVLKELKELEK